MKWNVKEWLAEGYRAKRPGALTAYIYRSLSWPGFFKDPAPAFEVKYSGVPIAVIRFEGKGATVRAHDPRADRNEVARQRNLVFEEDPYAAAAGAEAIVLVTGWAEYARLDWARLRAVMARPLLLDTQNMLDAARMAAAGFTYLDVGRGRNAGGST